MSISGPSARSYNITPLPLELLFDVFARDKDPGVLMTLALVHRQWKDVENQEAALWTDIRTDPSTTMRQSDTQLLIPEGTDSKIALIFPELGLARRESIHQSAPSSCD